MKYNTIIVGGGIAGLYTALQLTKKYPHQKILLLEKNPDLGGRIYTYSDKYMTVEAGAGRISDEHTLTLHLIHQLGLSSQLKKASTDVVYAPSDHTDSAFGSVLDAPNSPADSGIFTRLMLNSISPTVIKHIMDTALGGMTIPNAALVATVIAAGKLETRETLQTLSFIQFAKKVLTEEQIQFIIDSFGYYSELVVMNAYDALELMNALGPNHTFYIMSGGLSKIVFQIEKILKQKKVDILTQTEVTSIEYLMGGEGTSVPGTQEHPSNGIFHITYRTTRGKQKQIKRVECNTCICALPKWALEKIPIFQSDRRVIKDIQSVYCGALCRIYTTFPATTNTPSEKSNTSKSPKKVWFEGFPKMTTNNEIRMIIPIDTSKGVIMISYTDNKFADFWKKLYDRKGEKAVNEKLQKLIAESLDIKIPVPQHTQVFYWNCGVGYWKIGVNSKEVSERMIHPFPPIPLFVCGENYSEKRQQWIEGAIETSCNVLELI